LGLIQNAAAASAPLQNGRRDASQTAARCGASINRSDATGIAAEGKSKHSEKPSSAAAQRNPLGGLGEFGMNMTAIRYGDDIIVIDCGMMFPEAELLGVDLVMPDLTFLKENAAHRSRPDPHPRP
jgi:hypothetical protein